MKYALFTEMALSRDLPEHDLRRGDIVRVIADHLFPGGREGYWVEVCNAVGDTVAVTAVDEDALKRRDFHDSPDDNRGFQELQASK